MSLVRYFIIKALKILRYFQNAALYSVFLTPLCCKAVILPTFEKLILFTFLRYYWTDSGSVHNLKSSRKLTEAGNDSYT